VKRLNDSLARGWGMLSPKLLPFADAASAELPLGRLMRLSLFQVSVGMAVVLLNGTLNRVMIVELGVPAWLVALMLALPLLFAPFRALVGFRSDHHRSSLGWRRVPYIWMGTLLQFGTGQGPVWIGQLGAALAFLLAGAGLHTAQTAGLALATDLAPDSARPRVVALLYVMLLVGMTGSALLFGALLAEFAHIKLIQVVQGAAVATVILNGLALWKQEARDPARTRRDREQPLFRDAWRSFTSQARSVRFLLAVGLGTAGFTMQDVLLEPYGGEILNLGVAATTVLTALLAGGTLVALALSARLLGRGADPNRLAAYGALTGIAAFSAVIFAAPLSSALLFRAGSVLIGFGGGLFAVGTLTAAMRLGRGQYSGLALGAWGAVQASAAGLAIALGGLIRDTVTALGAQGTLGAALAGPATGYSAVYHLEILLLFAALAAIGPLVGVSQQAGGQPSTRFGLTEYPT